MEEKLSFEFSHDSDCWMSGYKEYMNRFKKRKAIIRTIVFGALALLFLEQVIKDPSYSLGIICLAVCIAVIILSWFTIPMEKKNISRALQAIKDDRYIFRLYADHYSVETILPETDELDEDENGNKIPFPKIDKTVTSIADKSLKAVDKEDYFVLFSATSFCVIPKKDLGEEEIRAMGEFVERIMAA